MTRVKSRPPLPKPSLDVEGILRFAAGGTPSAGIEVPAETARPVSENQGIVLSPDVMTKLQSEADRKGKSVEKIIEKLVSKHLGKH